MNFLAHLFLSCDEEPILVGNFLADFIRNRDLPQFPSSVVRGIRLHRKIDTYTDNHPIVRRAARGLYASHGKYAPVIIDVFYDYFLAKNWRLYTEQPLTDFTTYIYTVLRNHLHLMPAGLQERTRHMIADDWLMSYTTYKGLERTFHRMQRRVSRPALLEGAVETLRAQEEDMERAFNLFFPDVIAYVREECEC